MSDHRLPPAAQLPVSMDRRRFLTTAALGAAFLAGCRSDRSAAPATTTAGSGTTAAPSTVATTAVPTTAVPTTIAVPTTAVPTTIAATTTSAVASAGPVGPPLPVSDRWWLDANFGPVAGDLESSTLRVSGRLPPVLAGTWVRNGPNPIQDSSQWFLGDGMVHGVRLRDGRAEWYGRRQIATPFVANPDAGIPSGPLTYSNVSSVHHAGRLLSLGEIGFPYELDVDDLSTIGPYDFGGRLTTSMTAHPKIDPNTGEMFFFGYGFVEPFLTYMVADATGQLQQVVPIGIGSPTMVHDFAVTDRSAIFLDLAVQFDPNVVGLPYRFDRAHRCRLGVIDRAATTDTTRWFDIESGFVFHTINAHQYGSIITLDVVRYDELWTEQSTEEFPFARPYRYTVDLAAGTVTEGPLDDRPCEFPMVDRRRSGSLHTTSWAVSLGGEFSAPTSSTLLQYGENGSSVGEASYELPDGDIGSEALFVADPDRPQEGGGWLLMAVFRGGTNTSDLAVFDAEAIADGPVAVVHLPDRVPYGFHGSWSPI